MVGEEDKAGSSSMRGQFGDRFEEWWELLEIDDRDSLDDIDDIDNFEKCVIDEDRLSRVVFGKGSTVEMVEVWFEEVRLKRAVGNRIMIAWEVEDYQWWRGWCDRYEE